jgi:TRAP-type C4-dicarboxylate transport system permease large subunit
MNDPVKGIIERFYLFVALLVEILLGTLLGFVILTLAHYVEQDINSMNDKTGSFQYYVQNFVEAVLLLGHVVIVVLFVAYGSKQAWQATFGKQSEDD